MHDGQNLFDAATACAGEWEVDETLNALAAAGGREGDTGTRARSVQQALAAVPLGKNFSQRVGESAPAGDAGLRVGLEGVTGDSRCPQGAQCVWAGDATVRLWDQSGLMRLESPEIIIPRGHHGTAADLQPLRGHRGGL